MTTDRTDAPTTEDVIRRLNTDLRTAAKLMERNEARFLVDLYYGMQKFRIQAGNQKRAAEDDTQESEPTQVVSWVHNNMVTVERDIKAALGLFAGEYAAGQWLQGICGIAHVLSAGLLATLDIRDCPTVGHWWRFAGLDPTLQWLSSDQAKKVVSEVMNGDKKVSQAHIEACAQIANRRPEQIWKTHFFLKKKETKTINKTDLAKALAVRPFNNRLKTLCWKTGESFVKVQNRDADVYGKLYAQRKAQETERNLAGEFAEQAEAGAQRVGKSTEAYKHYSEGRLPPGHIHSRARRYTVKIFLSHFHTVCYRDYYQEDPPVPYAFTKHCEGDHRHYIEVPEVKTSGRSLKALLDG